MFPKVNWHGFLTPPPQDDQLPVDEAIELINKIIELKNQGADNEEIIKVHEDNIEELIDPGMAMLKEYYLFLY